MTQDEIQMPPYLNAAYEGDDLYTGDQVRELMKLVAAKEREASALIADSMDPLQDGEIGKAIRARGKA